MTRSHCIFVIFCVQFSDSHAADSHAADSHAADSHAADSHAAAFT